MADNINKKVKPYGLNEQYIKDICNDLLQEVNLEVKQIIETDQGYKFIGECNVELGNVTFDFEQRKYKPFCFNRLAKSEIEKRKLGVNKTTKQRHFSLQKKKKIGIALSASGLAILVTLGVIKGVSNANKTNDVVITENFDDRFDLKQANDLVALSWVDYAMNEINKNCASSRYELVQNMSGEIRTDYYAPIMTSYYNYLDQTDSYLPEGLVLQSKSKAREKVRSKIIEFNKRINDPYFKEFIFGCSPYVKAIVVDNNGIAATANEVGEVIDSEGNVLTYADSDKWSLYVPILSIPGNQYELGNLPEDAILHNGNIYLPIEHYYDFTKDESAMKR